MWDCRFTACLNTRQAQYQLEWLMESLSQRREKTKHVTQCWSLLNVCKAPCSALRRRDKVTNLFQLNISIQSVELFSGLVSSSAFTTLHISMPCFRSWGKSLGVTSMLLPPTSFSSIIKHRRPFPLRASEAPHLLWPSDLPALPLQRWDCLRAPPQ